MARETPVGRWVVVTPSNRPDRLRAFALAWHDFFVGHDVTWIVVSDGPEPPRHGDLRFCWPDLQTWMPRRTDAIRSYGFWRAWQLGSEFVLTLDDDLTPDCDLFAAYEEVFDAGAPVSRYLDVGALTDGGRVMRGFPRWQQGRVAVQYGGWNGMLDYGAETQAAGVPAEASFARVALPVPLGAAVTGCCMNMAWRREFTPWVWQLPLHEGRFNRWGDIWGGLLTKRACDHARVAVVVNGLASARHDRASDLAASLKREAPGLAPNDSLWEALPEAEYRVVVNAMARHLEQFDLGYAAHLRFCARKWLALFSS